MANDCWNHLTITSEDIEELKRLVSEEFQYIENGELVCKKNVYIHQQCPRGVALEFLSGWAPPYDFLELLINKYPSCSIKNRWDEEGGGEGIWIGSCGTVKYNYWWYDLCIEAQSYYFKDEQEIKLSEESKDRMYSELLEEETKEEKSDETNNTSENVINPNKPKKIIGPRRKINNE